MKFTVTLLYGMLFGFGIAISGMINPAKVLNFFDLFGTWDPSLAFVMGGALLTTIVGYRLVFASQEAPHFDKQFNVPTKTAIDRRLISGSILFGMGWGLSGFCPGGAIPALGLGNMEAPVFVVSMVAGIILARLIGHISPERNILDGAK